MYTPFYAKPLVQGSARIDGEGGKGRAEAPNAAKRGWTSELGISLEIVFVRKSAVPDTS